MSDQLSDIVASIEARFAKVVPFDEKQADFSRAPSGMLYQTYFNGVLRPVGDKGAVSQSADDAQAAFEANTAKWDIPQGSTLFWRGKPELNHSDVKFPDAPREKTRFAVVCRCVWTQ